MLQNKLQKLFLGCVVNAHIGPNPIILNQGEVFIKDKDLGFLLQSMNDVRKKCFIALSRGAIIVKRFVVFIQ